MGGNIWYSWQNEIKNDLTPINRGPYYRCCTGTLLLTVLAVLSMCMGALPFDTIETQLLSQGSLILLFDVTLDQTKEVKTVVGCTLFKYWHTEVSLCNLFLIIGSSTCIICFHFRPRSLPESSGEACLLPWKNSTLIYTYRACLYIYTPCMI